MRQSILATAVRPGLYTGIAVAGALSLAACGGSSDGNSSSDDGSGTFSLGVSDAPIDNADNVFVQFSSVTLVPAEQDGGDSGGEEETADDGDQEDSGLLTIAFEDPMRIDLLEQQNGNRELLIENEEIPAGEYAQIRLGVDSGAGETVIIIDGQEFDLAIPSGAQTGLKLNTDELDITDGGTLDLTIDFNLRRSIVEAPPGSFKLKPTLRLVNTDESGEIQVTVSETYVSDNQCGSDTSKQAVYVFSGNVTPDDVDGTDPDPVSSVQLDVQEEDGDFTATAGFLEPGTYTTAYTCNPEDDEAETDDALDFRDAVNDLEVTPGGTVEYNLPLNGG